MLLKRAVSQSLIVAALIAAGSSVTAEDLPVTTTRVKAAGAGVAPEAEGKAVISGVPRYYLDTIDNLNRITDDATRKGPGFAKNNYVGRVFEIYNTEAIEIQTYLLRILAYEGGVAEVMGADTVEVEPGKKVQYLFVVAPDFMFPGIEELVAKCDRKGFKFFDATGKDFGGGAGAVQYVGKHRTASELVGILKSTELGNVGNFLFPPFADDSTNSIYIVDNPTDMADNMAALSFFDKAPLQVELEVTIYETINDDSGKLGLDWDAWKRAISGSFDYTSTSDQTFFDDNNDAYSTALSLDAAMMTEFLNYTVQTGSSKVLTSTRLTMVNSEDTPGGVSGGGARGTATGKASVIKSTTLIPYTTPNNAVDGESSPLEAGVTVTLLPFIGTQSMTIDVSVEVSSLQGFSKQDVPLISTRGTNSVVNISSGKTLVIGGLDKTTEAESRQGIPGLKDIPVLQYLFSKEVKSTTNSKISVVLVPKIKAADEDGAGKL